MNWTNIIDATIATVLGGLILLCIGLIPKYVRKRREEAARKRNVSSRTMSVLSDPLGKRRGGNIRDDDFHDPSVG